MYLTEYRNFTVSSSQEILRAQLWVSQDGKGGYLFDGENYYSPWSCEETKHLDNLCPVNEEDSFW